METTGLPCQAGQQRDSVLFGVALAMMCLLLVMVAVYYTTTGATGPRWQTTQRTLSWVSGVVLAAMYLLWGIILITTRVLFMALSFTMMVVSGQL